MKRLMASLAVCIVGGLWAGDFVRVSYRGKDLATKGFVVTFTQLYAGDLFEISRIK